MTRDLVEYGVGGREGGRPEKERRRDKHGWSPHIQHNFCHHRPALSSPRLASFSYSSVYGRQPLPPSVAIDSESAQGMPNHVTRKSHGYINVVSGHVQKIP